MHTLSIDLETYSSVSLQECGVYRYVEDDSFEILLFAYSVDGNDVQVVDLAQGEKVPQEIVAMLTDPSVIKWAYNAQFERVCLSKFVGYPSGQFLKPREWRCSRVLGAYNGLPLNLKDIGAALKLHDQKMEEGKELIKYFCVPCKPFKSNGMRTRNYWFHNKSGWDTFKSYCKRDVEVELNIKMKLQNNMIPDFVWEEYFLDQEINDRGVKIDQKLVQNAIEIYKKSEKQLKKELVDITGLENPNSVLQLKEWLKRYDIVTNDLGKKNIKQIIKDHPDSAVADVLTLRLRLGKTSVKKYEAMLKAVNSDGRIRGMFSFYGASRSGRFSSKIVQLQNLPQNHFPDLDFARNLLLQNDMEAIYMLYEDVPDYLSQLIRTAFVPEKGKKFIVCDFSAIEARCLAWIAGETWRLQSFKEGHDIYVASASKMFDIPHSRITKELRQKGKIAELALGYGGSVGALKSMGALDMGLEEKELKPLVDAWRSANPHITSLWWEVDRVIRKLIKHKIVDETIQGINFKRTSRPLYITLPSGRRLVYLKLSQALEDDSITYYGINSQKKWGVIESYGPKFVENIVQGIARDLLCNAIKNLKDYRIVMHIHDEVVVEVDEDVTIDEIKNLMIKKPSWAEALPLNASGYETAFYKKD